MSDELLTAEEAAAFLKMSMQAFYTWRRRHHVPNRLAGRSLRFFKADLVQAAAVRVAPPVTPSRDFAELGRQHARDVDRELHRDWPRRRVGER